MIPWFQKGVSHMSENPKLNYRIPKEEYDTLRLLAYLLDMREIEIIRDALHKYAMDYRDHLEKKGTSKQEEHALLSAKIQETYQRN
jgi:hypothetical protein